MLVLMSVTWLMAYAFDATPRHATPRHDARLSVGSRTKQSPTLLDLRGNIPA